VANEPHKRDRIAYVAIPLAIVAFQLATAAGYGIFRDELYYLACANHLDWGFVDHPPLSILVLAFVRAVFGASLFAIRLVPALAAGATALLAATTARALGGGKFAQRLAALCAATFPLGMALGGFFSMNALDVLCWTAMIRVVVAILDGGDPRLWLLFGAIAGAGLQNKISVLFLGFGLAVGLVAARRWELFRSRWIWLGSGIAVALFLPHVIWQIAHGWPTLEFMDNARRLKLAPMTALAFLREQFINAGPQLLVVWTLGAWYLLTRPAAKPWRAIGWTFVAVVAVMIATGSKPYYLGPIFPAMFAAGAVAWERGTRRPAGPWIRGALVVLVLAGAAALAPLAKALLPEETFIAYARALHITPASGERNALGRLPQHFADMHGWQALAETVAKVKNALPPEDQPHVCVFGQNYGEAGAIDRFGPALGIPGAVSAHNAYWMWGPGDCPDAIWIVIGDDRETLETIFDSVELGATFTCDLCMPYENDNPIWVCRRMKMPIDVLWLQAKKFV
jgi:hypothetical protein